MCPEDVSLKPYVVLTNSSNIDKTVLLGVRCWDSLGGNAAGVVDFMKKSIGCVPIFNTRRQTLQYVPNRVDLENTNLSTQDGGRW